MWITIRHATADTYFTEKKRIPWSAEMRHAKVYDTRDEAIEALFNYDSDPGPDVVFEELPDPGRYSNKTNKSFS